MGGPKFTVGQVVKLLAPVVTPGRTYHTGTECSVLRVIGDRAGWSYSLGDGSGVWMPDVPEERLQKRVRRRGYADRDSMPARQPRGLRVLTLPKDERWAA